jgi:glutaminyl-tRNA synthetase
MTPPPEGRDFIRQIIDRDLAAGGVAGGVVTRFPPEPNGFLHIGHAKSIVLNFGIAEEYEGARCHLRFDDTNPTTEDVRYVEAIQNDVRWLGCDWGDHLYFASDYFEALHAFAVELIEKGLAYVDSQSEAAIREGRGTVTKPGTPSPYRDRSIDENLDLFARMRAGGFGDGEHVLRARIDMASPNMLMRDPLLYRIRHAHHYRTGDAWCIYPLYDFAHALEDAIEGVTHSLCTLEFENNREIYDWLVENVSVPSRPRQYEFARLNLDYTVMSKRKLLRLVNEEHVSGWDDPRMPTIAGLRRRGVTPEAIRGFCEMVGVARADSRVDIGKLEYAIRDDLNQRAPRVLCVLHPLRVTLTNWPEEEVEELDAPLYPHDVPLEGSRPLPFSRDLWIERDDFAEDPPKGFRRLVPGGEVRLRYGYVIRCDEVVKDDHGNVIELRCTYDPETRGGDTPDGRRIPGTIHWVSAARAVPCHVRLYDRLFNVADPDAAAAAEGEGGDFTAFLNPGSLAEIEGAVIEPSVLADAPDLRYQFERLGYFWRDPVESSDGLPVFNRIVTLRDTWARRATASTEEGTPAAPTPRAERGDRASDPSRDPSGPGEAGERPELPPEVRERAAGLVRDFGLDEVDAGILARAPHVEAFFRAAVEPGPASPGAVANWMIHELPPVQGDRNLEALAFGPAELSALAALLEAGRVSSSAGRRVLEVMADEGGAPTEIVARLDLAQESDPDALEPLVHEVIAAHPDEVAAYRSGKKGLIGFFIGQIMRQTRGRANPELTKQLLERFLG